ncbi:guanine nucleotide exchange protein for ADP-robosylation factor [Terramyces sp. JEL0728]|nr:guanine nucleotide exchange protein for ADP-robosylation factor [Terramyces sp. JEL0728]
MGDKSNNPVGFFSNMISSVIKQDVPQPKLAPHMPNLSSNNSGDFFIRMSMDMLNGSKEIRRNETFRKAITVALETLDHPTTAANPLSIFKPFQLACQSKDPEVNIIAIDCLGKLFTYNYWKFAAEVRIEKQETKKKEDEEDNDGDNDGTSEMITFVIDTICDTFVGEGTDDKVQLQIIKALQAALTNSDASFSLHGATLLKAIRTTYNIFLLSKSNDVQTIAQGTVTQMVQNVLNRIPNPLYAKKGSSPMLNRSNTKLVSKATISDRSRNPSREVSKDLPALPRNEPTESSPTEAVLPHESPTLDKELSDKAYDREFKDAFKVFRTLCILSAKAIPVPEGTIELRSQPMRSKLLALYLISSILQSHLYLFKMKAKPLYALVKDNQVPVENFKFIDAIKELLIVTLSRNATSMVPPVFDVCMELFGNLWAGLRQFLKKEMNIFFTEIIIPILEARKNIVWYQRHSLFKRLGQLFADPQLDGGKMLVEIYLNYDCDIDSTAKENIWERMMNAIGKVTSQHVDASAVSAPLIQSFVNPSHGMPQLTTANLVSLSREQVKELISVNGDALELRKQGVKLMGYGILKPLYDWCSDRAEMAKLEAETTKEEKKSEPDNEKSLGLIAEDDSHLPADDPTQFGNQKLRKQNIIEGIKKFNVKPKKGVQFLLDNNCIRSRTPRHIALFLASAEGINKTQLGDFLGEGEEENIAIMHAFVEQFEFIGMAFVEALRQFLQSFRLPGEAQKIDRFMLKFAEIYVKDNPSSFTSADTAYVLAYSVIMLNTDQHNTQVKRKMSKHDFLKNNRGIDGGKDLPEEVLSIVFDEIVNNEIIMKDEQKAVPNPKVPVDAKTTLANTSADMALKTEAKISNILRRGVSKRQAPDEKGQHFIAASHHAHVKPMFEIIWMSVLSGLSTPLQESEDVETIMSALEGVKNATRIACLFDLDLEKQTLLSTLSKFTLLNNLQEMKAKNFEAIKTLLDITLMEGDHLDSSWKDVVSCISNLEKLQIVAGLTTDDPSRSRHNTDMKRKETQLKPLGKGKFLEEAAAAAGSQSMTLTVDRIFTSSSKLSGTAIVHFVRALCESSWDEISSSNNNKEQIRMYCLQRLVEISYYNMKRIRVEWSNIWAILGPHFDQVGCYPNTNVAFFALDKLRQLAMKFLEIEELPNFKFQKEFLRPFEEIVKNNTDPKIKDMCLVCVQQIIQVKGKSLKSGWKTLFEQVANLGFDLLKAVFKNNYETVVQNGSLPDLVACAAEYCKNKKYPKLNSQSLDIFKQIIGKVSETAIKKPTRQMSLVASPSAANILNDTPVAPVPTIGTLKRQTTHLIPPEEDICIRYWMPVLFGLHDLIMTCDLEVRTKALQFLFDTLKSHGEVFTTSFWEILTKGVLFPIFDDMKQTSVNTSILNSKFANKEELNVWLSTTLIQALRQFVELFTHYYSTLGFMLDGMLGLLKICILHENEALSRIGATCIQQLVEHNNSCFGEKDWALVCKTFQELFDETAPTFLFFNYTEEIKDEKFAFLDRPLGPAPEKKEFQKQLARCVLHLHVVQTLQDVLATGPDDMVYKQVPSNTLILLLDCFRSSFHLAHVFNETIELRQALFKKGYMKNLPNLLKQETLCVNAYLMFLIKIYTDPSESRQEIKNSTQDKFISLCLEILKTFNTLEEGNQRNLTSWRPVIIMILNALVKFDDGQFKQHAQIFYTPVINLLMHDLNQEIRMAIHGVMLRIGKIFGLVNENDILQIPAAVQPEQPENIE